MKARPRIRLRPDHRSSGLWDVRTGGELDPEALGVSPELRGRLAAWHQRWESSVDEKPDGPGDELAAPWPTYDRDTRALWAAPQQELGERYDVERGR